MGVTEILQAIGVADPILSSVATLFEQMIADGTNTTTAEQAAALNSAIAQVNTDTAAFEDGTEAP